MGQTNPALCPYCGAEMEADIVETKSDGSLSCFGFMRCSEDDCYSASPMVFGQNKEETERKLYTAAQRRYVPPIKPMTPEEIRQHYDSDHSSIGAQALYIESKDVDWGYWAIIDYYAEELCAVWSACGDMFHGCDYNRTWRCWARRPTDEERAAAAWEVE